MIQTPSVHSLNRRSLLQLFVATAAFPFDASSEIEIETPLGRLQGTEQGGVRVFLGVPFTQPPVDKMRFLPPSACQPWTGVRRSVISPPPIQPGQANASEDCLYLNIFAPVASGPHPVFVWIYGGGNIGGYSNTPMYDGSKFARDGVVCVVINYRVGALGFLELAGFLEDRYAGSGNNAIADEVEALRWVKQNIFAFGGNPERVTVGGESAGAKNVAALITSSHSHGLFERAIMESGSAQTVHSLPTAQAVTRLFLSESKLKPEQLLTLSAADLLEAQTKLLAAHPANYPFRPVVDKAFLPDVPLRRIASQSLRNIDLLIGTNRDESSLFVDSEDAALPLTQKELGNAQLRQMERLEAAYQKTFPNMSTADLHVKMLTAEEYWMPSVRIAETRARHAASTFMYRFDHTPKSGRFANRAAHASELAFVWDHAAPDTQLLATSVHAAWVSFIKTGRPIDSGLPPWPAFRLPGRETMMLNDTSHVESDPNRQERRLWK